MSNEPLPSRRCILGELPFHHGEKVRFLGCVTSYNTHDAILSLGYGLNGPRVSASVDVKLVLESLKPEHVEVGQWVHVIGYVTDGSIITTRSLQSQGSSNATVQALIIWTAEDLDISLYEESFAADKKDDAEGPSKPSSTFTSTRRVE